MPRGVTGKERKIFMSEGTAFCPLTGSRAGRRTHVEGFIIGSGDRGEGGGILWGGGELCRPAKEVDIFSGVLK